MLKKKVLIRVIAPMLALSFAPSIFADSAPVKGRPAPGHVRPPLYINLTPAASTYYTPAQIRHAYGFDQLSGTGSGQKIAIVDAYGNGNIQNDLNTFCTQYTLPQTTVQILGNNSSVDTGWALETALDVEWAHVVAPGATIILSVAASSSSVDLLNAVDAAVKAGATVVSMSWGGPEFYGMSSYDGHFNVPNVTFVASSGDSGAGVEWPAASPYVLGVGGTSLYLDSNNNRTSETAWSGSGGGSSMYYSEPFFQNGWQSSGMRGAPDVSYDADPSTGVVVYDSVNGGWFIVGGTSAGAPQWAGLIALANNLRAQGTVAPLGWAGTNIYAVAQGNTTFPYAVNAAYFYDVSQGNNGAYNATAPYDFVTGLGSPIANALVPALVPSSGTPPVADFSISANPTSNTVKGGHSASYTVTITPAGGFSDSVSLAVSGLPSGATGTFSSGSIPGSGSATLTVKTSNSTARGSSTLTITGTSNGTSGSRAHSTSVSLRVR